MQEDRHMKIAVSFFSLLVVLIGAMLFVQYQVYSDHVDTGGQDYNYSQEIEIVYRGESLDVRQHFKNLPNQRISINWPKDAMNPSCFIEAEYSCTRLSEDVTTFEAGETRSQSVSYIIPLDGGIQSRKLMKNLFVTLSNGDVQFSTVHISTDSSIEGQWVTGLPLIGQQSLSLVNYTMFSGAGQVKDLFWQAGNFSLQKQTDSLSIYSKTPLKTAFYDKLANVNFINDQHIAIINGDNLAGDEGYRMLFIPDLTVAKVQQNVIISQVESLYKFGDSPHWMKELVASYLTGTVFGSDKTAEVVNTLTTQMTDAQLKKWTERLTAMQGEAVNPTVLDEMISEVLGAHTRFITMNAGAKGVYPFLYNDVRDVYLNEYTQENIQIILKDGQILYSAVPLLNALGYEAAEGKNGFYVNNETRVFRFPVEPGFYVFNQRRYNTVSEPVKKVAGDYYIEESWLQRLFLVELKKTDKRITILSTTAE